MTKLNFYGMQSDIEALFNRYDENGSNEIDYKLFAYCACGFLKFGCISDEKSFNILQKIRSKLVQQSGIDCMPRLKQCFINVLKRNQRLYRDHFDASATYMGFEEFYDGLIEYGLHISYEDCIYVFNDFCNVEQKPNPLLKYNDGAVGASIAFQQDFYKMESPISNNGNQDSCRMDPFSVSCRNNDRNGGIARFDDFQEQRPFSSGFDQGTPVPIATISLLDILNNIRVRY